MKSKMYPKAGLGKVRMPKRFAEGGRTKHPSANEDMPPPKRSPQEEKDYMEAVRNAPRVPRRPMTKEELKARGFDVDAPAPRRFAEGGFASAFKQARDAGEDEFTWNGKRYTTRREEEGEEYKEKNAARRREKATAKHESKMGEIESDTKSQYGTTSTLERMRQQMRDAEGGQTRRDDSGQKVGPRTRDRKQDYERMTRELAAAQMGPIAAAGTAGIGRGISGGKAALSSFDRAARRADDLRDIDPKDIHKIMKIVGYRGYKSGGSIKAYAKGGRIDGVATKGKTRGRMI